MKPSLEKIFRGPVKALRNRALKGNIDAIKDLAALSHHLCTSLREVEEANLDCVAALAHNVTEWPMMVGGNRASSRKELEARVDALQVGEGRDDAHMSARAVRGYREIETRRAAREAPLKRKIKMQAHEELSLKMKENAFHPPTIEAVSALFSRATHLKFSDRGPYKFQYLPDWSAADDRSRVLRYDHPGLKSLIQGYLGRRFGNSASTGTRNTPARVMSSMSVTHRTWSSIRATMSRLTSHPDNWHFAANCACDKPSLLRNDISRGPTAFLGSVIRRHFSDGEGYLVSPLAFVWFSTHVQIAAMKGDHP